MMKWIVILLIFLWCTWANLEQGHLITHYQVRIRDLEQQLKECR